MSDYSELKRLSEAATPGPWVKTIDGVMPEGEKFGIFGNFGSNNGEANRGFIAAANPAAVLALIAEVEVLNDEISACKTYPGGCGYWREAARMREQERNHLKAEVERLTADNTSLRGSCAKLCSEHSGMVRQIKKLKGDKP